MPEHIRENISAPPEVQTVVVVVEVAAVAAVAAKGVPVAVAAMVAAGGALLCRGRRAVRDFRDDYYLPIFRQI